LKIPEDHDEEEVTITDDIDDPLLVKKFESEPSSPESTKKPTGMVSSNKVKNINVTDSVSQMNNTGFSD